MGLLGIFLPFWLLSRLPVKHNSNINAASDLIKQVCRDLIAEKRAKIERKERTDVDIVSVALESGAFSDEDLVNQMMTFLVSAMQHRIVASTLSVVQAAGHETTATALIWAIYNLCRHQDVQKRLRDEVRSQLPSPDAGIAAADIDNCHYLQAVCSEVLRLYSPVSTTLRVAACDTRIGEQFVPKDTLVILCPWAINTSKQQWGEDSHEFNPDRWLDADGKANNK